MERGVFCLSLDTELLWGRFEKNLESFVQKAKKERTIIKKLLWLFNKYQIPATWAFVGHLFLDQCQPVNGVKHPAITRPNFPWFPQDWFTFDPATNLKKDPLWYGKDIVDLIKKTPNQEIASHTFSHLTMGHPGCSEKCANSDLTEWVRLARKEKIKFKSFVFPYNSIGHLKTLKRHGFICYRGKGNYWFDRLGPLVKFGQIIDYLICLPPPTSQPKLDQLGLVNIPESMFYLSMWGLRKYVPIRCRVTKAKKGILKAIEKKTVFHLWFHPINLSGKTEKLTAGLEEIIQFATQLKKEGQLEIKSMGKIAKDFLFHLQSQ